MTQTMVPPSQNPLATRYSLLSRLQNWDDQDSWRDFFNTYWRLIYSTALKSGLSESEAEDVVQETVISVAKSLDKFKRDRTLGSFKGWLRNIIRWRMADQFKKRPGGSYREAEALETESGRWDPAELPDPAGSQWEAVWEKEWQTNLMETAKENVRRNVKEEHYQIFDLYVLKQWPVKKIARTLGVSIGQIYLVKYRISRLLKKEVHRLEKWD
jgi:RNA polymerase sigma-70 factor (ECF subfamily)